MRYSERNHKKRIEYLRALRKVVKDKGSKVYLDESGFERTSHRVHGWGLRGKEVYGECSGKKRPRTSLISAKQGKRLLAPSCLKAAQMLCCSADQRQLLAQQPPIQRTGSRLNHNHG